MAAASWVLWAAGLVAALGVLWRSVVLPAWRWANRLEKYVQFIEGQMRRNGGHSVKDAVERIDARTARLERRVFGGEEE
jgi:hypothetical protein